MPDETHAVNYPDILGYITGGVRTNINVVQVALTVRPRVPRAGRPFEAILLIQNASNVDVDVTATLHIPEVDAKKQKNRFIAKSSRLVVGLRPAEVGYVVLPLSSLPDTAVSDQYKVGMGVEVKALEKPARIRLPEGGGGVAMEYLTDETIAKLNELKKLTFSVAKRGLMGTIIEAPFNILSAQLGQLVDLKPGWVSLWKMSDYKDDRLLLDKYGSILTEKVLPNLKRDKLYPTLFEATHRQLRNTGYDIEMIEVHYIAKLMVALLEAAVPDEDTFDPLHFDKFNIDKILKKGTNDPAILPGWCRALLKAIDRNPSAADNLGEALESTLYDELLRDCIAHAFDILIHSTGADLGSEADMRDYGERLIGDILKSNKLTFVDVYLPLALGGVIVYDRAVLPDEKVGESLTAI
ncbi:MAG: hypothetical protein K8I30_24245, partial [Anaerolineae bacterium]|nr:hypothetical protein [Anaerolineae bacterium]